MLGRSNAKKSLPRELHRTPRRLLRVSGGSTILIVEDDRVVRDHVARGLDRLGYNVLEAQNGRDLLMNAPSPVSDKQLRDVHLLIKKPVPKV